MFFSWFNLPRIWNAAVDQELRSPPEYPYFACYFFHSFKNIQKPWVVCPETKDSGSTISQSFEIPAVKHRNAGSCRRPHLKWGSSRCQAVLCLLSWASRTWKHFGMPCFSLKIHWSHYISRWNASGQTGQQLPIISLWLKFFMMSTWKRLGAALIPALWSELDF